VTKYSSVVEALAKVRAKTAYLDGELCGIGGDGLASFSRTQTASDGSRAVRLVYFVFDLLHRDGRDIASLPLIERKALLETLVATIPNLQFNGHETGDGELIRKHAGKQTWAWGRRFQNDQRAICAGQQRYMAHIEVP
jgi:bifunctional non-homologous end joining protein LigD